MLDLVYIAALTALLSLLTWGVIVLCRSLKETSWELTLYRSAS